MAKTEAALPLLSIRQSFIEESWKEFLTSVGSDHAAGGLSSVAYGILAVG